MENDLVDALEEWVGRQQAELEANGLAASLVVDGATACFDVEAATRSARLTLRSSGEAVIDRAEWSSDLLMIPEQRTVTDEPALAAALSAVVEWASTGGPRPGAKADPTG